MSVTFSCPREWRCTFIEKSHRSYEYRHKERALWKTLSEFFQTPERQYELYHSLVRINSSDESQPVQSKTKIKTKTTTREEKQPENDAFGHVDFAHLSCADWSIRQLVEVDGIELIRNHNMCFILSKDAVESYQCPEWKQWLCNTYMGKHHIHGSYWTEAPYIVNAQMIYDKFIQLNNTLGFDFFRRRRRDWFAMQFNPRAPSSQPATMNFFVTAPCQVNAFYFLLRFRIWERLSEMSNYFAETTTSSRIRGKRKRCEYTTATTKRKKEGKNLSNSTSWPHKTTCFSFYCQPPLIRPSPYHYMCPGRIFLRVFFDHIGFSVLF